MAAVTAAPQQLRIETAGGTAVWRTLEWDSQMFGMSAARLDSLEAGGPYAEARAEKLGLLTAVLDQCRQAGVRHLSARVDCRDLSTIHALEHVGFEWIDGIQTFLLNLEAPRGEWPAGTRHFQPEDLEQVLAIARTAFVFDRFHADPALSSQVADQVNETWTRNCCDAKCADAVIVAEEEGRIASFVTCSVDREAAKGVIILIATAQAARGKGAAHRVSLAALQWFAEQAMKVVEVGTQLSNIPAAGLYESLGFRLSRTSLTFRKVL